MLDTFYNPVAVHVEPGGVGRLNELLAALSPAPERVLLFTRGGDFRDSDARRTLLGQLAGCKTFEVELAFSNPDVTDLFRVLQQVRTFDADVIVAVGGGTVLDVAKTAALLGKHPFAAPAELREAITDGKTIERLVAGSIRWIGVPTTAGTGSEVTPWATIWDKERKVKYSVEHPAMFAAHALIDPLMTVSVPKRLTVSTGLDALCHAAEAYWAKRSNTLSREYAVGAIRLIAPNLPLIVERPENPELRGKLALGSLYAGLAFSNTRTTACHSISYPLTLLYGIEHGIAVSLTLASVMRRNEAALIDKKRLLAAFGAASCDEVETALDRIYRKAGLSRRLRDYGVPADGLKAIAEKAHTKGRMDNNPVELTVEQVYEILREIY